MSRDVGTTLNDISLGSSAAWAQRTFWGAAVKKGSWFSALQRAGMKGTAPRKVIGGIGAGIGVGAGALC